jgi:hypothetical protein
MYGVHKSVFFKSWRCRNEWLTARRYDVNMMSIIALNVVWTNQNLSLCSLQLRYDICFFSAGSKQCNINRFVNKIKRERHPSPDHLLLNKKDDSFFLTCSFSTWISHHWKAESSKVLRHESPSTFQAPDLLSRRGPWRWRVFRERWTGEDDTLSQVREFLLEFARSIRYPKVKILTQNDRNEGFEPENAPTHICYTLKFSVWVDCVGENEWWNVVCRNSTFSLVLVTFLVPSAQKYVEFFAVLTVHIPRIKRRRNPLFVGKYPSRWNFDHFDFLSFLIVLPKSVYWS